MDPLVEALAVLPRDLDRLAVAFSGGSDSSALLHAAIAALGPERVRALHVCHHLQPEAERWASHCVAQANAWGVECSRLDVVVDPVGQGMEAGARRARYQALAEALQGNELLASAHHAEDQAETFLIQALRGSGVRGLAGMPTLSRLAEGWLWRPWLGVTREAIDAYAQAQALCVIDDPTNHDPAIDRGYIRQRLWPALSRRWPAAATTLGRSARWAAEAAEAVQVLAELDLAAVRATSDTLLIDRLLTLSSPRRAQVLRLWIEDAGFNSPDHRHLEQIMRLLNARERASPRVVFGQTEVRRFDHRLFVMRRLPPAPTESLSWSVANTLELPAEAGQLATVDSRATGTLQVRFRRGGEQLMRADGRRITLKDWFSQQRVPPWLRERMPLVYAGQTLVAVADYWAHPDSGVWPDAVILRFVWRHQWPRG